MALMKRFIFKTQLIKLITEHNVAFTTEEL